MRRIQILSIVFLLMLVTPFIPQFLISGTSPTLESSPSSNTKTPILHSPDSNVITQPEPLQPQVKPSASPTPDPVVPDVPDNINFTGNNRGAGLYWNKTQPFFDRDNSSDIIAILEEGYLYREILNFTRIEAFGMDVIIEDDPPLFYVDLGNNQPLFIGFRIMEPVRIDGFWVMLNTGSRGWMEYAVYRSQDGLLPPIPDLVAPPVVPISQIYVDDVTEMKWVWFDVDESIYVLDPSMTYANTFFLAFWKIAPNWKLYPLGLYDSTDGEDESDVYFDWSLTYWADDYLVDFAINPIDPFYNPSEMGMTVNSTPVLNTGIPGTGWWQNILSVPIHAPFTKRYYNVSLSWTTFYHWPVTFDGIWLGSYYNLTYASARVQVWIGPANAIWTLNMSATFPPSGVNRIIRVSIEKDWNVNEVRVANAAPLFGTLHSDWIEFQNYVQINSARDGFWTIICNAPDYLIQSEVRNASGYITTKANSSEEVTIRGYVQDPLGQNATNGFGYLLIYDPDDYFIHFDWNPLLMPPGGLIDINWSIWLSATVGGKYACQISWWNGTEAGLSAVYLEVYVPTFLDVTYEYPPEGEPVIRGDKVHIEVLYFTQYGYTIDDASITVINDTSGDQWGIGPGDTTKDYTWYNWAGEGFPGYYTAILFTENASANVLHNITLYISSPYHEGQNTTKQFSVKTRATHILFFWEGQPLPGLNNISDSWFTSPHPYINDTSLQFTIRYIDDFGLPITGAQLTPYIVHESQGVYKRLDWIELSIIDPTKPGMYNITIDTNPIAGKAFHEGDPAYIVIHAAKFGYESTWSDPINVQPQPRPSFIDVPVEFRNLVLYENWQYPTSDHPTILRVILRDALNGEDLSHGSIKAEVPGIGNATLTLATPGIGLYEIANLSTTNLSPGTYIVTLYATARDFVDAISTLTLTIYPKQNLLYEINFDIPSTIPNHLQKWSIDLQFYIINTSIPSVYLSSDTALWNRAPPNAILLEPGTPVTLLITADGGSIPQQTEVVDVSGWVHFEGVLEVEGDYSFSVTLEATENYAGMTSVPLEADGEPISVQVMSFNSVLAGYLPLIAIIAAIVIMVPLGAGLAYRRYVFLPKRRQKLAKYQAIADTFSDVANLNRLLVLHKESGICVFDPFAEESQDATLVAGFLQAISTFGHDLVDSPGLTEGDKDEATTLRELTYEGFRILIHDGNFVRNALVLSGTPSDQLRDRLEQFTLKFEKRYKSDFEHWEGRVDQFNNASDLVEQIFLISLRHPHTVAKRKPRGASLSSLESDIYKLAKELTIDREYIFLGQILSTYLAAAKHDKLEALMAIYQLRMKKFFLPLSLEITPLSTAGQEVAA